MDVDAMEHRKTTSMIEALLVAMALAFAGALTGCGEGSGGGTYCCQYETRSTGCGGTGWKEWESGTDEFDIVDYQEGWTPERVCNKYTGSGTECGGSCCINYQYRDNTLSDGLCSGG